MILSQITWSYFKPTGNNIVCFNFSCFREQEAQCVINRAVCDFVHSALHDLCGKLLQLLTTYCDDIIEQCQTVRSGIQVVILSQHCHYVILISES